MKDPAIYLQQFALAEKGFYRGALDGDNGPITKAAFTAWLASRGGDDFAAHVNGWGLRHFAAAELLVKGAANARLRLNTDPPRELWDNIRDTAKAADEARERLGSGLIISSAYRSPAYNRAIGGAPKSYHMRFRALDLIPARVSVATLHAVLQDIRDEGFPGCQGIGRYPGFCHIDDGPRRNW